MYVMIDHQDSFVYNLVSYFKELNCDMCVLTSTEEGERHLANLHQHGELDGLVFSPGPKTPFHYESSLRMIKRMAGRTPILGICLGHQLIGCSFEAKVEKGAYPMHGKVTQIAHHHSGLFFGIPTEFEVTRYHSLVVSREELPRCFRVDAVTKDGAIMAMSHRSFPLFGLQYHPEAVLTQYGYEVLDNFKTVCEGWCRDEQCNQKAILV